MENTIKIVVPANIKKFCIPFLNFGVSLILDGKVVTALFSQLPLLIRHPLRHSDGQYSVHSLPYRPK